MQDQLQDIEQEMMLAGNKRKYEKWATLNAGIGLVAILVAFYFHWWYIGLITWPHSIAYKYYLRKKYPFTQEHLKQ